MSPFDKCDVELYEQINNCIFVSSTHMWGGQNIRNSSKCNAPSLGDTYNIQPGCDSYFCASGSFCQTWLKRPSLCCDILTEMSSRARRNHPRPEAQTEKQQFSLLEKKHDQTLVWTLCVLHLDSGHQYAVGRLHHVLKEILQFLLLVLPSYAQLSEAQRSKVTTNYNMLQPNILFLRFYLIQTHTDRIFLCTVSWRWIIALDWWTRVLQRCVTDSYTRLKLT